MPDTFAITIVFIILATVVAAFVRRKSRDKCLRDFLHDLVTLEETTGKAIPELIDNAFEACSLYFEEENIKLTHETLFSVK